MVSEVAGSLGGIAGGLLLNILYAIAVGAFAVILWYATKWYKTNSKKQKSFTITAVIIDKNAFIDFDKLGFLKSDIDGMLHMAFQKRKQDSLPPLPKSCIRNNIVLLYNYGPGQYSPVIPESWGTGNLSKDLKLININMKNYIFLRQRAVLNKAQEKQTKFFKMLPWITFGIIVVGACVSAAISLYFGGKIYLDSAASRMAECMGAI